MSDQHRTVPRPTAEQRRYARLPDEELTARIRAGAPTALPARQELRRRHFPALLSYARLCTRNQTAGDQLAHQSFDLAAQETCRGIDPRGPWRHHLLLLVHRVGALWAAGNRRERLDPGFVEWLDGWGISASDEPDVQHRQAEERSPMLGGFFTLPSRTRGILWYGVVDNESAATVGTYLGIPEHTGAALRGSAQDALRQAYLRTHLERSGDPKCQGFRGLIEAAVRPGAARRSGDLNEHLAECASCARVFTELVRLGDEPRTVIADGLLGWGGAAYVTAGPVHEATAESVAYAGMAPPRPDRSASAAHPAPAVTHSPADTPADGSADPAAAGFWHGHSWWATRSVAVAAVAVTAAAALVAALVAADSGDSVPVGRSAEPPLPAPTTVTATATATLSAPPTTVTATPSKKPAKPHPSPSPSVTSARPTTAPPHTGRPSPRPIPFEAFTQVVNSRSGLCLDVRDERLETGNDVITARCDGSDSQQWRLDFRGLLHTSADPDFCLDSRGDTDRGVGIWDCSAVDGDNGRNLQFMIDRSGTIRPLIAPDFAVTPRFDAPCSPVELLPGGDQSDQQWNAGTSD